MLFAGVAELVDAPDLGSGDESCGGSSPSARTIVFKYYQYMRIIVHVSLTKKSHQRLLLQNKRFL
jgi:hypothetical protein